MADPRIGTVVDGRYRVDERLAAGGTGIVYIGTQLGLDRAVAIKFLHKSSAQSRTRAGRFEREAQVMSQIGHANVAQIIDFGFDEDHNRYLVMELCRGTSLRELLKQGPMDLQRAIHTAKQILAGLGHAHEVGIVHRDLKPGNVQLVDSLGEDHVKILDFGVAKIMSEEGPTELSVAAGRPLGTPHYMSPEQATSQAVDARTDIYALGVMMYEMTTGQRPFDAGIGFALLRQQVEDTARPPGELREMSRELESLIVQAMEKDPADRFQTAAEMMEALDKVPEASGADKKGGRGWLWVALAVVLLGGAGGAGWYGYQRGWFDRWLSRDTTLASTNNGDTVAQRDASVTADARPSRPPWKPASATVVIPPLKQFPSIDNKTLTGRLYRKKFHAHFAILHDSGDTVVLHFTEKIPATRLCSELTLAELGGPQLSVTLPRLPGENERIRSGRRSTVEVLRDRKRTAQRARWRLRFNKLDADALIGLGNIRIDGRTTRLRGTFIAAYCPGPAASKQPVPTVNGVALTSEPPEAEALPEQAVAGVFDRLEMTPKHVNLTSAGDPLETTLTFFARVPKDRCARLTATEPGVVVRLPGPVPANTAMISLLPAESVSTEPSAVFRLENKCPPDSTDCARGIELHARALSLKVDSVLTGELRGRIYLAAPGRRSGLLVGAFRARDCRKAGPPAPRTRERDAGTDAATASTDRDGGTQSAAAGSASAGGDAGTASTNADAGGASTGGDGGTPHADAKAGQP
jgi:serine/threonine-protein kinase